MSADEKLQYTHNIDAHVRALGQKYMGIRPNVHQELLEENSLNDMSRHDVLVDNFLNAQCKTSELSSCNFLQKSLTVVL
jgi:saccharopepsin